MKLFSLAIRKSPSLTNTLGDSEILSRLFQPHYFSQRACIELDNTCSTSWFPSILRLLFFAPRCFALMQQILQMIFLATVTARIRIFEQVDIRATAHKRSSSLFSISTYLIPAGTRFT